MARSTARKRALNTLYEADEKSQDILSLLDERIAHPGAQTPLPDYAIEIVKGVAEHRRQIDMTLDEHSTGWKVRRMGVVDRNILRIAAWEILFTDDVPDKVAIDEALALAKTLCDDDSPAFIHGLLSAVCTAKNAAPAPESMGGHLCRRTFSSRHLADSPASGVRLCAQRRVSLRWPLTLVRIPEKHKGVLVSQNESGTIAIPMYDKDDAVLVLEDGQVYVGESYGALGETTGEIVFATGMTGYQETLTDPSYDRQIVVQTFPHIGDTGVNSEDPESSRIWVAGYIVRDPSPNVSNWRAEGSLDDDLAKNGIVGLSHIDTRKLVRHLRSAGVMRAGIFSGDALTDQATGALKTIEQLLEDVKNTPQMQGLSLYDEVSTKETYTIEPCGEYEGKEPLYTVAAVDLGIKGMTPHRMAERGCRVHVVPSTITFAEIENLNPDGVFFSNGPGDPEQAGPEIELLRQVLDAGYPFFGICFGNQLLGRALGFGTYKLKFGHRGINQPVKDLTTGKVEVTAHNHGFAVDAPIGKQVDAPFENGKYGKVFVSHIDLNDDVVEGLQCVDIPAFSVQYHPEAAAGPHDAAYLFDRFCELMKNNSKEGK